LVLTDLLAGGIAPAKGREVIEKGNPADSVLAANMIERQIDIYRKAPRQAPWTAVSPPKITSPPSRHSTSKMSPSASPEASPSQTW
jgi:hypothetical protein